MRILVIYLSCVSKIFIEASDDSEKPKIKLQINFAANLCPSFLPVFRCLE